MISLFVISCRRLDQSYSVGSCNGKPLWHVSVCLIGKKEEEQQQCVTLYSTSTNVKICVQIRCQMKSGVAFKLKILNF